MTVKNDNDVEQLEQMGFSKEQAKAAFERAGSIQGAVAILLGEEDAGSDDLPPLEAILPLADAPQTQVSPSAAMDTSNASTKGPPGNASIPEKNDCREIISLEDDDLPPLISSGRFDKNEEDLAMAIEHSLQDQRVSTSPKEAENPYERRRDDIETPAGLRNIGNTCYFNSILQTYFGIPELRNAILAVELYETEKLSKEEKWLQELFAHMLLTKRKYSDPTAVLKSLSSENGKEITIGNQEDPTEFSLLFLERLKEGLVAAEKRNKDESYSNEASQDHAQYMENKENIAIDDRDTVEGTPRDSNDASISNEDDNTIVAKLLEGHLKQTISARSVKGGEETVFQDAKFLHIILDISHGDLWSAMDSYTSSMELEDYVGSDGERAAHATQSRWFKSLPPVLTFQLQRVVYDSERKEAVKIQTPFDFPETLFMERYMECEKESTLALREEVAALREDEMKHQRSIRSAENYEGSNCHLITHLQATAHYLDKYEPNTEEFVNYLQLKMHELDQRIMREKQMVQQLQQQQVDVYKSKTGLPYHLYATLVHDGVAGSGHYWAFLNLPRGRTENVWFKFNDTHVTPVDANTVWTESRGGHLNASAYCLIYVDKSRLEFRESHSALNNAISPTLQIKLAEDNSAFDRELQHWDEMEKQKRLDNFIAEINQKMRYFRESFRAEYERNKNAVNAKQLDERLLSFELFLLFARAPEECFHHCLLHAAYHCVRKQPMLSDANTEYITRLSNDPNLGRILHNTSQAQLSAFHQHFRNGRLRAFLIMKAMDAFANQNYQASGTYLVSAARVEENVTPSMLGDDFLLVLDNTHRQAQRQIKILLKDNNLESVLQWMSVLCALSQLSGLPACNRDALQAGCRSVLSSLETTNAEFLASIDACMRCLDGLQSVICNPPEVNDSIAQGDLVAQYERVKAHFCGALEELYQDNRRLAKPERPTKRAASDSRMQDDSDEGVSEGSKMYRTEQEAVQLAYDETKGRIPEIEKQKSDECATIIDVEEEDDE